jgi:hypothetical protein
MSLLQPWHQLRNDDSPPPAPTPSQQLKVCVWSSGYSGPASDETGVVLRRLHDRLLRRHHRGGGACGAVSGQQRGALEVLSSHSLSCRRVWDGSVLGIQGVGEAVKPASVPRRLPGRAVEPPAALALLVAPG